MNIMLLLTSYATKFWYKHLTPTPAAYARKLKQKHRPKTQHKTQHKTVAACMEPMAPIKQRHKKLYPYDTKTLQNAFTRPTKQTIGTIAETYRTTPQYVWAVCKKIHSHGWPKTADMLHQELTG